MAARPKSGITADTDVNLDFLTKEEKEALLSKKMDMIRQRNRALTERHKLIEADKKKAEAAGQAVKPSVDSQTLPAEGAPKARGRGRGQPPNKDGNRPGKERPKSSGDIRDSSNYEPIVDMSDLANYRSRAVHEREISNNVPKNKKKSASKDEAATYFCNIEYEPIIDTKDLDKWFGRLLNAEVRSQPHTDHGNHPAHRHPKRWHDEGPPPDPSFNPLADRRRSDKKDENMDHRRHPRNYGGNADLSKVKQSMKNLRDKERERPQGNKPLELVMTGKERRNHEEWKAERERCDKERIQRQMSDAGNWKRAWDADKLSLENEEQSALYSSKVEPAKRPAGRIGSGRFDRGERDERPRSAVIGKVVLQDHSQQQQRQHHHEQQSSQPHLHHYPTVGDNKASRGRGRGRGRGRSRGSGSSEKFPRPRTWSGGDDRFVECQKELLLVKFDNTAGDNSVEVEYDDEEFPVSPPTTPKITQTTTTPGRGPTGRTLNQAPKKQSNGSKQQQQINKVPHQMDKLQLDTQLISVEDKWNVSKTPSASSDQTVSYDTEETHTHSSSQSQSFEENEEWEGSSETPDADEDFGMSDLHSECRLNPEAPEFLPGSADIVKAAAGSVNLASSWTPNDVVVSDLLQGDVASLTPTTQRLSASSEAHSRSKTTQDSEKVDETSQTGQSISASHEQESISKAPDLKHVADTPDLSRDVLLKSTGDREHAKPSKGGTASGYTECVDRDNSNLTIQINSSKGITPDSSYRDNEIAAFNSSGEQMEETDNNTAASPRDKTRTGISSALSSDVLEQTSTSEESEMTSKESVASLMNKVVVVDKDFSKEVSTVQNPAMGSTKSLRATPNTVVNGDGSVEHKLNEESTVSGDHTSASPLTNGDTDVDDSSDNRKQERQQIPTEKVASETNGSSDSSDAAAQAGLPNSPAQDKSSLPTADVSAFS